MEFGKFGRTPSRYLPGTYDRITGAGREHGIRVTFGRSREANCVRKFSNKQEYRISTYDQIRVDVSKHPELSKTVVVNQRGEISLPSIQPVEVSALTVTEVAKELEQSLEPLNKKPHVTISVLGKASHTPARFSPLSFA